MNSRQDPGSGAETRPRFPAWKPVALISAVALLAHCLCLRVPFYFDDQPHLLESPFLLHGTWYQAALRTLAYFFWFLVYSVAGFSPAAFHALNLTLHILVCIALYFVACEFLRTALVREDETAAAPSEIALWSALLMAVHPLGTEPTHYAAEATIQWVTLFSLLAAGGTFRLLQTRRVRWLAMVLCSIALAAYSKEVGVLHSGMNVALILGAFAPWTDWRHWMRRRWKILAVAGLPLLIAGFLYAGSHLWLQRAANSVQNPALGWHVLTQSRVLWQYAWRMFLPLRQCSDHLIPLTSDTGDVVAWISLGALLALLLFIRRLHRRNHRAAALLLSLTLAPLILRFFYMAPDPMVEYRTYPALPWFALVVAFLAAKATPRAALRGWRRAMCAALVLLAALCIRRSLVWQNPRSLVADIVGQYPLHVRPLSYLQWFDSNSGHLDDVIRRQEDIGKRLNAVLEFNRFSRIYHRRHDAPGAVAQFMLCEQFAGYALIGKGDPAQAIDRMTQVIQVAQRFFGTDDAKAFAVLYRVRGKAKAAQGDTAGAAEDYRRCLGRKPGDPEALALLGEIGASPASP